MINKLSHKLREDFLSEMKLHPLLQYWENRTYEMSYHYLIDLIQKVEELEEYKNMYEEYGDGKTN
jgi:hypothetical protein